MNTAMIHLRRTSTRALVVLALAHAIACDPTDASSGDEASVELRDGVGQPPNPSLIELVGRPPLYPVQKVDKGHEIPWNSPWIHSGYDPRSGEIIEPGGRTRYTFDANALLPYGTSDVADALSVCDAFLEDHDGVPLAPLGDLDVCEAAEQGCCDYVCKAWGGQPDPVQRVAFVEQKVMKVPEIYDAYVPEFMAWNYSDPEGNGGLGRDKACACNCVPL